MAYIEGTPLYDILESLPGDDEIDGKDGQDLVSYENALSAITVDLKRSGIAQNTGGAGWDTLISIERLRGSAFDDHLIGDFRTNFLYGGAGNDQLFGGAGSDRLYGEAGNDILDGGTGADFMRGGEGDDLYYVDNAGDVVEEWWKNGNGGIDTVRSSISYALPKNVENLILAGSAAIDGTGNAADNIITGNSGNNVLSGGDGDDSLHGADGDDVLHGGAGENLLDGGEGFDFASYAGLSFDEELEVYLAPRDSHDNKGNELTSIEGIVGTSREDYVYSDLPYARLYGGNGYDELEFGLGGGEAYGGAHDDILIGGRSASFLYGEAGDDILFGGGNGAAITEMRGGIGNDIYVVRSVNDLVIEEADEGIDLVAAAISYVLPDAVENVELHDDIRVNQISLTGNDLANNFNINGSLQNGIVDLHGGGGADIFGFGGYTGQVRIDDFTQGEDRIVVPNPLRPFVFNGSAGQSGNGNQAWTTQNGTTTTVHFWFAGAEQVTIDLLGVTAPVTINDFLL